MTPTPTARADVVVVRRNPWVHGLAAFPFVAALAIFLRGIAGDGVLVGFTVLPAAIGLLVFPWVWRTSPAALRERVVARVGAYDLTLGQRIVPRDEIRAGLVLPGDPPLLRLLRRRAPSLDLEMRSIAEARALLRALGLDASRATSVFHTQSRTFAEPAATRAALGYGASFLALLASAVALHSSFLAAATLALGALGAAAVLPALLIPTRVQVGADGIALRWLGGRRFIGYGDIAGVRTYADGAGSPHEAGIELALTSGALVRLPGLWSDAPPTLLDERIREALETFRSAGADDAALLRRGRREISAWVTALRAVGAGAAAGLRTAALPRERLLRIVESPSAAAADRAAAAVALSGELDDEGRDRMRSTAAASAAPRLRVVLEAAAQGSEDAEIEAALAELEQDDAAAKSSARGR